jgi:DNA mismatch repair ATPase MutS
MPAVVVHMQAWLKAPLVDPAAIQQRLDIVEALVTDQGLREAVRDALRGEQLAITANLC